MAQSEKKQTKQFFAQLRKLATTLERDVPTVQAVANRRLPPSTLGGPPLVLLSEIKKEVDEMMRGARAAQESLRSGNRLLELVEAGRALLDAQKSQVEQVESYLQQYGYTPLQVTPSVDVAEPEVIVPPEKETADEESPTVESESNNDVVQEEVQPAEKIAASPAVKSKPVRDEFYSPKLEDFGLSEDYLAKCNAKYARLTQPAPAVTTQMEFKVPTLQPAVCQDSYVPPTPESFSQVGAFVTPGMFSGREIPTETPSHFLRGPHVRGLPASEIKPNCSLHLDFEDASVLSGASNNNDTDLGNISGIAELSSKESKFPEAASPLHLKQVTEEADDSPSSPLLPVFTSKVGQKFAEEIKRTALTEVVQQEKSGSSTENSPIPPEFMTPGLSLHRTTHQVVITKKKDRGEDEDEDLPKRPVLNRNLDYDSDEFELPKTPEFTTDFSKVRAQLLQKPVVPLQQHNAKWVASQPSAHSLIPGATLGTKENLPPAARLTPATPSGVIIALIDNVTPAEYSALPEYLRKVVSLSTINSHLATVNRIFIKNIAKRENAEVTESDLHAHIGQSARIFSLLMTRLKRLRQIKRASTGTVYVPYDVSE